MENQTKKKYNWVIKDFSSLRAKTIYSDRFVIGGCKWHLQIYPQGENSNNCMSLFLSVANAKALAPGWCRYTRFSLTIINQLSQELSHRLETEKRFDQNSYAFGFSSMLSLTKLHAKDGGFLVNGELKIVAEINVLEVTRKLDVLQESEEATQPPKKKRRVDTNAMPIHSLNKTPSAKPSIDVYGFKVLSSQVELVKHIFRKHPDIAVGIIFKNEHMKTASMNFLISLIETLCKSIVELTNEDLVEADNALTVVKSSGFKVDWLEKKLVEVKAKKKEQQLSQARIKKAKTSLKYHKQRITNLEAQLEKEKEKAKVLIARGTSLTLDDVI